MNVGVVGNPPPIAAGHGGAAGTDRKEERASAFPLLDQGAAEVE